MHPDPARWSLEDVLEFFQHQAVKQLPDRAQTIQRSLDAWLKAVVAHNLTGHDLLEYVNFEHVCGQIHDLGGQIAISECIKHLRKRSIAAAVECNESSIATPPASEYAPQSITSLKRSLSPFPPLQSSETTTQRAPKRLKLHQLQTITKPAAPTIQPDQVLTGCLPRVRMTANQIFYGDTQLSAAIDYTPSTSVTKVSLYVESSDNLGFIAGVVSDVESRLVWRRMRHFFKKRDVISITRNCKTAAYVLPYPPTLSTHPSATVVLFDKDNRCVAVRENVFDTASGLLVTTDTDHHIEDEYSHLLHKYGGHDDESPLPLLDDDDDIFSITSDGSQNDDEAEEGDDELSLSADLIKERLQLISQSMQSEWEQNKLGSLQVTKARSVWDKMKQSRSTRSELIARAEMRVSELEQRLARLQSRFQETVTGNITELDVLAGSMQPTIEDILEQKWMIDVYKRRQRPASATYTSQRPKPISYHKQSLNSRLATPATPAQPREDRFSPSPPLEDIEMHDSESLSRSVSITACGQSEQQRSAERPSTPDTEFIVADDQHEEHSNMQIEKTEQQCSNLRQQDNNQSMELATPTKVSDDHKANGGHNPEKTSPATVKSNKSIILIDLLSDSSESTDSSRGVQSRRKRKPGNAKETQSLADMKMQAYETSLESMTAEHIELLDAEVLSKKNDRRKLLLKLLAGQDSEFRDLLFTRCKQDRGAVAAELANRLRLMADNVSGSDDSSNVTAYQRCACLLMAWYFSRPSIDKNDYTAHDMRTVAANPTQLGIFVSQLMQFLTLSKSKLFRKQPQTPSKQEVVKRESIPISSDEEDSDSKHKKPILRIRQRKRKIKPNVVGVKSRQDAHERARQFLENSSSHIDNSQQAVQQCGTDGAPLYEINPGREGGQPAIHIESGIARKIKQHQIEGVRFLWRELTNDSDEHVKGCLLAHPMGLGKTMQTITTMIAIAQTTGSDDDDIYMQLPEHLQLDSRADSPSRLRILLVSPAGLLSNWEREITHWDENKHLGSIFRLDTFSDLDYRIKRLEQWRDRGGVMLLGQEIFRNIVLSKAFKERGRVLKDYKVAAQTASDLLIKTADIAVLDEAQIIKNGDSDTSHAMKQLSAKARIALTGTPLSNAITEIYEIINWVAPGYLGDKSEFNARFTNPICHGLYKDCTPSEHRLAIKRLQVLRADIEPKCHRSDISVLEDFIPPKVEFMLTVGLSQAQTDAYKRFISTLHRGTDSNKTSNMELFAWFNTLSLLITHPWAFRKKLTEPAPKKKKSKQDHASLMIEETASDDLANPIEDDSTIVDDAAAGRLDGHPHGFTDGEVAELIGDIDDSIDPSLSAKAELFLKILKASTAVGDTLLVFSQYLTTLTYLERALAQAGIEYSRIDGKVTTKKRMDLIADFEEHKFDVMLVGTSAGSVGLNMHCANRVVIFDASLNPTNEQQAIGRAYRLKQKKPVFVYRLICGGTFEKNIENRCHMKTTLAQRVVDKKDYERIALRGMKKWLYDPEPVPQADISEWLQSRHDPKVLDLILQEQIAHGDSYLPCRIYGMHTAKTFEVDATDEVLDDAERAEVQQEIQEVWSTRRSKRIEAMSGQPAPL